MKKIGRILVLTLLASIYGIFLSNNVFAIEESTETPELYIKSINPGYTVDGQNNVGEYIELARSSDSSPSLSLAGFSLSYTNSSGNTIVLYEFSEYLWMSGETILLRLASSPESEQADLTYTKTLALKAGPLELKKDGSVLDSVCWTSQEGCVKDFKANSPTLLLRNSETFEFEHKNLEEYSPKYDIDSPNTYFEAGLGDEEAPPKQCANLIFSEILTYYEDFQSEQFVEFYNPTSEQILLNGCFLKYKNKSYPLSGIVKADSYLALRPDNLSLTKNPTTSNTLELYDTDGTLVDSLTYLNGQQKSTSYAQIGYDDSGAELWKITYAATPNEPNVYQQFKTCEEGKVINESTGNCVKATTTTEVVCDADQYLNPLTGRCKKYETETEIECKEGYELNPETNRCRKIKENNGAEYELASTETEGDTTIFIAIIAITVVFILALGYLIFEFRAEIKQFFQKVWRRFHRKPHP